VRVVPAGVPRALPVCLAACAASWRETAAGVALQASPISRLATMDVMRFQKQVTDVTMVALSLAAAVRTVRKILPLSGHLEAWQAAQ